MLKDETRRAEFDELRKYGGQSNSGFQPPPGWQSASGGQQSSEDFSDFFNSMFGGRQHSGQTRSRRGQDIEVEFPVFLEDTVTASQRAVEYTIPTHDNGQLKQIKKHLNVKIPQGVVDGERIRLKGQGVPGFGGGEAGIYICIFGLCLIPYSMCKAAI
nr:DnaJ C-terminal domain-containing protein [Oceanicoccus sp. KOV_DT_Chl]